MMRLGKRLHDARLHKKLSLEEVARATKIKSHFLAALERGDYHSLPSPAYAQGFVKNYAAYLELPQAEIAALFRREFDEKKAYKVLPDALVKREEFPLKRIRLQQSLVIAALVLFLFFGYLLFQYRYVFIPPSLTLSTPVPGATVKQELIVSGKTDSNATVLVNNNPVTLNEQGEFTKRLSLFPGKTNLTVKATNRLGKETTVTREIVVR